MEPIWTAGAGTAAGQIQRSQNCDIRESNPVFIQGIENALGIRGRVLRSA